MELGVEEWRNRRAGLGGGLLRQKIPGPTVRLDRMSNRGLRSRQFLAKMVADLDLVLGLGVSLIIFVLNFVGILDTQWIARATLGVLALVAFAGLREREDRKQLEKTLASFNSPSLDNSFDLWRSTSFAEALKTATSLDVLAVAPVILLEEFGNECREILRRKGRLRFLINSNSGSVGEMARASLSGETDGAGERMAALSRLRALSTIAGLQEGSGLEIRELSNYWSGYILSIIGGGRERVMYITFHGYHLPARERISVTVRESREPRLFGSFEQQFERLFHDAANLQLLPDSLNR
jgi:hypothetical protein